MSKSLREILSERPDLKEKTIKVAALGGEEITIKLMTMGERRQLMTRFRLGAAEQDALGAGVFTVATCCVPPITEEEIESLPSSVIDEISAAIMEFNGWTKKGAAEQADQFRAAT